MSRREAPLYMEAHDLARWIIERMQSCPRERGEHLAPLLVKAATELVEAVSISLTFPADRVEYLRAADRAIVRLRTRLRLARDVAMISPGGLRFAAGRLQVIGQMVGGWRKRVEKAAARARAET